MNNPLMKDSQMIVATAKVCKKCKIEKEFIYFCKEKSSKDGLHSRCKNCVKEYNLINKEKRSKNYINNAEKIKLNVKNYRDKNKILINEKRRILRKENIIECRKKRKEYNLKNKDKIKNQRKIYRLKNLSKFKQKDQKYYKKNKKVRQQKNKLWHKNKILKDNVFALKIRIRGLINQSLKRHGYTKKSKTFEILGCDFETFKKHIELQFIDGMNWESRGEWHIDHVIPVSSAKDEGEMILLNHYLNLQPLWANDNLSKGCKMPAPIQKNKIELSIAKEKGLKLTQQSIF
jgi:hypothetical protein